MREKMCYMMATIAHHNMGDISRDEPDLCWVETEDGDHYIGSWVEGYGFTRVKFPKATTRELTDDEKDYYNGCIVTPFRLIRITDAPNAVPVPETPLVVRTKNSVYRLGKIQANGIRAILKDGSDMPFDWCEVRSLVLHKPLVLMGLMGVEDNKPIIPFASSNVEVITTL